MNEGSNYFLDLLFQPSETEIFSFPEVMLAMTIASLLSFVLSLVYRHTHRGTSYSQSFILTMFMMAVATAVVMMIIGSNIARAFSLVGALSIIRFRTAVKDPRDTGFLFAAMIAGMGCGTGFYLASMALTGFLSALVTLIHHLNFGMKEKLESIVRVTYRVEGDTLERIEQALESTFGEFKLINRILDFGDDEETNVYVVRPGSGEEADIERRLGEVTGVVNLAIYQSDQHAPF